MTLRWQTAVGLVVSLALLYWALHDVSLAELWGHLRAANLWLLFIAIVIQTSLFAIRAARWAIFLKPVLRGSSFHSRFATTCIGFMANNLLPARVGEFARAYAFSRVQPVTVSASFGSLVVERLFDALTLAVFLAVPLLTPGMNLVGQSGDEIVGRVVAILVILGGAATALLLLIWRPALAVRFFRATIGRLLPGVLRDKIAEMIESFVQGLGAMRSPELVVKGFAWSFLHWGVGALALYVGMIAFRIFEPGYLGAVFLQAVNAFGVSIPSSPGFFGLFEASVRIALAPFGVDAGRAVSFAVAFHIGSYIPVTVVGLYYLGRLGLSWSEVGHSEEIVEESA
ncbi:MAG: flippase-like domain-containing protein [Gemmatimonadetes bacterium]|uniref:Flippase-like domain-containing protein n=1 Tax=Candidatus Kutchimonas denitrificans TaxID=3056748 RepID=A0AAE4Z7G1_9BACT|nr:flippase-like domain-containing protein [Gemmatimonadota bacterium]NIR75008.1 flippase-like domain-containing protein [Candidatus Kutchimonas denitrificans]NIS01591.1 flippase-like domain-containing protein [Gemmatimonadota bacterium]NIT67329.1 flippase-like domain-containing protein [Gemmatimonadota bacterium]NIU52692.1 flippase-like domain-containing protein [Gemmatimonadota bacterium]